MIRYLDLKAITALHGEEIQKALTETAESGWYLLGERVKMFENEYAKYIGTRHCVATGNGLDALWLILRAWKEMGIMADGDEVIVPANTYIASILSVSENGLRPVLVEPNPDTLQIDERRIEEAITPRTKAVMIVHLYGICAFTERISEICKKYGLKLMEDNAQGHGTLLYNPHSQMVRRLTGSLGDAAAHSFYPGKNLGALGDAGCVTTNDDELAAIIRALANYGSERKYVFGYEGINSRMDEIQASVLSVKLKYLAQDNERRRKIAKIYCDGIRNPNVVIPKALKESSGKGSPGNSFHIFPILSEKRDSLKEYLANLGIETMIHYPIPPHLQRCYANWKDISLPITEMIHSQELSLPCNQAMTLGEADEVVEAVNSFDPS